MRKIICALALLLFAGTSGWGDPVADYVREHQKRILTDFVTLLEIPNEASDTTNIHRDADWIVAAMNRRGLNPRLLKSKDPAAPDGIYGEYKAPGAKRTLLFYAHYDGQPADPDEWSVTPPFKPIFRAPGSDKNVMLNELSFPVNPEIRIYARSASDDKGGVMAILTAFDAVTSSNIPLTSNLKFYFEGEEEAGSPHMSEITAANKDLLNADAWILIDGPMHQSGRKIVDFGVRGDANVDLTIYGPARPLHSGHYGNWAPNPAMRLVQLLATMKDDNGRVLIAGWYDDVTPLGPVELNAVKEAPPVEKQLQDELGVARPDGNGKSLMELILEPSLNINGIRSADVGDRARNVIPTNASVTLDLRLVKGNDVHRQYDKLIRHIQKQGYTVLDHEPSLEEKRKNAKIAYVKLVPGAYNAQRTPMDLPISLFVTQAVQASSDQPIVKLPASGGSLPLSIVEENIGCALIGVSIANHDNNQHAENENLRLQNFWSGIDTIASIFTFAQK